MNTLYMLEEDLDGYCGVSEWHITPEYDNLNEITSANEPLYSKIAYQLRVNSGVKNGPLQVNT